ncbi:MAG: Rid family hydrolase [Pseudomonadota bacterium]|nr:Rid family hydrolase [Pseudomonadota bacterium]
MQKQTCRSLEFLDESLEMASSNKIRILQGQIFLADMSQKADMDVVWNEWIGPDWNNWPQRASVGAALTPGALVEIF